MSRGPKVQLSELRRIGWRDWDPIGLSDGSEFGPPSCADEYDDYLLEVVRQLRNALSRSDAASYLWQVASGPMGLSRVDSEAAKKTVDAIAEYLTDLHADPHIADRTT